MLVDYLADPTAFGRLEAGTRGWTALSGLDPRRLELVGLMTHSKRFEKVERTLPRTIKFLRPGIENLALEWATRHRPLSASSFVNACQFYLFLQRRWRRRPPLPPFLPDLAYCELAMAAVGHRLTAVGRPALGTRSVGSAAGCLIRRRAAVHWRRCEYNLAPVFAANIPDGLDVEDVCTEHTCVLVSRPLDGSAVRMFQVDEVLFELVVGLQGWSNISFGHDVADDERTIDLFGHLERVGILEVKLCASAS